MAKTVSAALARAGVRVVSGAELRAVDEAAGEVSGGGGGSIGGASPRGDADLDFGGEAGEAILGGLQVEFNTRGGGGGTAAAGAAEPEQQDTVRSSTTSSTSSTSRQQAAAGGGASLSLRASLLVCADERDVDPVFFKVRRRCRCGLLAPPTPTALPR